MLLEDHLMRNSLSDQEEDVIKGAVAVLYAGQYLHCAHLRSDST